jgi:23S rRNA (uracil1939-C5)-methyltransferase
LDPYENQAMTDIKENNNSKTCPHYGDCGGCKLHHLDYSDQLKHKVDRIIFKLKKHDPHMLPVIPAPFLYHYRNKIELTFFPDDQGKVGLGFHRRGSFLDLINLDQCVIAKETNADLFKAVRHWANKKGLAPYYKKTHTGLLRYLIIRDSIKTGEKLLILITNGGDIGIAKDMADSLKETFSLAGVLWSNQPEIADAALLNHVELAYGQNYFMDSIGDQTFKVPYNAFFQTNNEAATILYDTLLDMIEPGERVLDLFCGAGTISTYIAKKAESVFGIEVVEEAIQGAFENAKINNVTNTQFIAGRVRERLAHLEFDNPFDTIILDPPRSGTDKKTCRRITKLKPKQIIYVACGLGTLAFNLSTFKENGYVIESIQPIDMFPHTPHVEAVIKLVPA